jgi:hypothetical protein
LIENWPLTFFVVTEGLAIWETGLEKIMSILPDNIERENRIYVELFAPKKDALKPQKYIEIELFIWDGLYLGLDNYYKSLKNVFEYEGACFMGGYGPANEPYNIAHFLGYDSMERISLVDDLMYSTVKRSNRMKIIIERLYKLYTTE